MITVTLDSIPNQSFSIRLDNKLYNITIKQSNDIMIATIIRDGILLLSGIRIVAGTPLIPYQYLESGNFMLLTTNGDLPDYTQFQITQFLVYASRVELEVIRATA